MQKNREPRTLTDEETQTVSDGANAQCGDLSDPKVQDALNKLMGLFKANNGLQTIILQTGLDGTPPEATIRK